MAAHKTLTKREQKKAWERPREGGRFAKQEERSSLRGPEPFEPVGDSGVAFGPGGLDVETLEDAIESAPFLELGRTGLRQFSGIIDEEFLPQLRGRRAMKIFQEMRENDPTVGAMLFAVEMLMRAVEWRVEPGGGSPADLELAAFIDSARGDMADTWPDTLASIFSFLPFGFSIHEEVYKRRDGRHSEDPTRDSRFDDGRIGWRKLPVRAQDSIHRWVFDHDTDEVRGIVQLPPPTFRFRTIPAAKYLHFRTTAARGNPEGRSVLRSAYRPWFFKKRIEEIEGIGVERDLAGLPKMEVPAELMALDAPPAKKALLASFRTMLGQVRRDEREGILIPRQFDKEGNNLYSFELTRSGGRRQFDTTQIVNRYDRAIASVVLADFILLGQQRVGSFALAETKTELFGLALGAWLDSVTETFNRTAIPRLLLLNGLRLDNPPQLVHGDVESIDLAELGAYVTALSGAGMPLFPDDELENVLRTQGGFPEKPEGLESPAPPVVVMPPQPGPPEPGPEPEPEPDPEPET